MGIQALLLISASCIIMNLIQSKNVISLILFYSLSMISAGTYDRKAEWALIGGKNYDFNPVGQTQSEASARCIRFGGKLFEPRDAQTNRNVFTQAGAKLSVDTKLWIGISDVGEEASFTYLSDGTLVNWVCESSASGTGCWQGSQPVVEAAFANSSSPTTAELATRNLDCVFGTAKAVGKWAVSNCVTNIAGAPTGGGPDFGDAPAKFGSICERAVATPGPITTTAPPGTSDSTCLKSGITIIIAMLFFCYQ